MIFLHLKSAALHHCAEQQWEFHVSARVSDHVVVLITGRMQLKVIAHLIGRELTVPLRADTPKHRIGV
jgi:hypothetical protein